MKKKKKEEERWRRNKDGIGKNRALYNEILNQGLIGPDVLNYLRMQEDLYNKHR